MKLSINPPLPLPVCPFYGWTSTASMEFTINHPSLVPICRNLRWKVFIVNALGFLHRIGIVKKVVENTQF
jgi:hypothetical protein